MYVPNKNTALKMQSECSLSCCSLFIAGKTNRNNIQAVYSGGKLVSFSTIFIAYGFFTDMMYEMERQTSLKRARFLGTFDI